MTGIAVMAWLVPGIHAVRFCGLVGSEKRTARLSDYGCAIALRWQEQVRP